MRDTDWTKGLGWHGYRAYRHEINEGAKTLKVWVRRKRGKPKVGVFRVRAENERGFDVYERDTGFAVLRISYDGIDRAVSGCAVRIAGSRRRTFGNCRARLPSASALRKRWDKLATAPLDGVWGSNGGEHGASHRCALHAAVSTSATPPRVAQMGVDEIYLGKKQKFLTVVTNLAAEEALWFG